MKLKKKKTEEEKTKKNNLKAKWQYNLNSVFKNIYVLKKHIKVHDQGATA